jgi:NADH-quinone oxidoreductase subunit J
MSGELILFLVLAVIAIMTALGMLFSRNAVYSALFLVLNFVTVAIFYLLLSAPFIAMAQITVYAGAIMVLFLFVIMLLGAEAIPGRPSWQKFVFPSVIAGILAIEAIYILVFRVKPEGMVLAPDKMVNDTSTLVELGKTLFSSYLLPFEVTSILLLVAMVGAIVLTRKEKGGQK